MRKKDNRTADSLKLFNAEQTGYRSVEDELRGECLADENAWDLTRKCTAELGTVSGRRSAWW